MARIRICIDREPFVMDLQIQPAAAVLASPAGHAAAPAVRGVRTARDRAATADVWIESGSRYLLRQFMQEGLPLVSGREFQEP